jgi:hypothetical protein
MNTQSARPILQAALFLLLSVTLLPGASAGVQGKGFSTVDPFTSTTGMVGEEVGKPDGYDDQVNRVSFSYITSFEQSSQIFFLNPAPVLDRVFYARQARAPPKP